MSKESNTCKNSAQKINIKQLPHNHGRLPENLVAEMPGNAVFDGVADVFALLGDGTRVRLFWLLCHCEECVANLSMLMGLSSPALSHHLKLLKNAGLTVSRREGREVHYTAAVTPRAQALHNMIEDAVELSCPVCETEPAGGAADNAVNAITALHDYLLSDLSCRETVEELAVRFNMNRTTLQTEFRRVYGAPIATYMRDLRIRRAMELLRTTDRSVADVGAEVGYASQSKFTQAFREACGKTPREYRAVRTGA